MAIGAVPSCRTSSAPGAPYCASGVGGTATLAEGQFRGSVLRQARQHAALTQAELALRAGVRDGARIRSWERGVDQPSAVHVPRLAVALGIHALELYEVDQAAPPLGVLRRVAGLTLIGLSRKTGLTYARCQRIEKGVVKPTNTDTASLARALGVSRSQLKRSLASPAAGSQLAAATRNPTASAGP